MFLVNSPPALYFSYWKMNKSRRSKISETVIVTSKKPKPLLLKQKPRFGFIHSDKANT